MTTEPLTTATGEPPSPTGAKNACKLCTPLGACMVFMGVEGCVPFLHGSQGCATYIRRYLISHFREPVDIASSSFTEEDAVFGGARNLLLGLSNVETQYKPSCIGVATTCLSETIGEDVPAILRDYRADSALPLLHVSTAAYRGSHLTGFHDTVRQVLLQTLEPGAPALHPVNLFPGMVSPADLRHLREILAAFGLSATILPDYADTLDGGSWEDYQRLQKGGTPLNAIRGCGMAKASIELGETLPTAHPDSAARLLHKHHGVTAHNLPLPIGLRHTDKFIQTLEEISGTTCPATLRASRARLVDSLVDGHKYLAQKRIAVVGDPDLACALTSFLCEIGVVPAIVSTGFRTPGFEDAIANATAITPYTPCILNGADHETLRSAVREHAPEAMIASSKSYPIAREAGIPLLRVGFPIHDRIGAQRILHLGYAGTQNLYDNLVNLLLEARQTTNETAWSYL